MPNQAQAAPAVYRKAPKPPEPLTLLENKTVNWKIFKKRWNNYVLLAKLNDCSVQEQVAELESVLAVDVLLTLNGFRFETPEDDRTPKEILDKLEEYAVGELHETMERYTFGKRGQAQDEEFDKYLSDLQQLIRTCAYCTNCEPSLLRDRIVLGIHSKETREDLLKVRKLDLPKCIDICRASASASSHSDVVNPTSVNTVTGSTGSARRVCKFCDKSHVMKKEMCPAWGKTCKKCGKANHFESRCRTSEKGEHAQHDEKPKRRWHKKNGRPNVNYLDEGDYSASEEEDSNYDWCNMIATPGRRSAKCKMSVEGRDVTFLIDTGASINTLPAGLVKKKLEPYPGTVRMWNAAEDKPLGSCRLKVTNPKNGKKYFVPFVVFQGDRLPILSYQTSLQMKLIKVEVDNFNLVAAMSTCADEFASVFDGKLGTLSGLQRLELKPNSCPVVMANRRVPLAVRPKLRAELDRLVDLGVITPVEEATPWVSQTVVAHKKSGAIRVCLDPHDLNKCIVRERYTLPVLEDVLHELRDARVFSKADLSSGYWHVQLDEESSYLTTFQTCFGRYRYLRLPFGINGASEYFQRRLGEALRDLPGVICIADDVVIYGRTADEHDKHLKSFLARCLDKKIKLNREKLDLGVTSLTFMGHRISSDGLQVDPEKVSAISKMREPTNLADLRQFIGMVNYLAKFLPNLTALMRPLHNLLKKDVPWNWSNCQQEAFDIIKGQLTKTPVLAYYNPDKPLTLENDACEYGIGSALLQEGKPIAFASRSLSDAETRYAQIEKEMLAATYGLEKFHHYTFGRSTVVITDHKPLVAISKKPLSKAPKRLQNLLLRAQKYSYELRWKPGSHIPLADALSRAPTDSPTQAEVIHYVMAHHMGDRRLQEVRGATAADPTLKSLILTIMEGWPNIKSDVPTELVPFFHYRDELTVHDGIVYRADRVVIPQAMRRELKQKLHEGHLGINSCLRRARDAIYWPGMSTEIRQFVETCGTCASDCDKQPAESPVTSDIPERPWQKIASDLCTYGGKEYMITIDYHSNFFEIDLLNATTSDAVIMKMKAHFARNGSPDQLVTDNGPQYSSAAFKEFAKEWQFKHDTSSPGHSQSNGAAEAAVKIAKRLLKRCHASGEDPFKALLNLRNTPTEGMNTSPAQRHFGRRTKSMVPTAEAKLRPGYINPQQEKHLKETRRIEASTATHKDLKTLNVGETVRIQPLRPNERVWKEATVTKMLNSRSYEIEDADGHRYRRNRRYLRARMKSTHSMPPQQMRAKRPATDGPSSLRETSPPRETPPMPSVPPTPARATPRPAPRATLTSRAPPDTGASKTPPTVTRSGRTVTKPARYC